MGADQRIQDAERALGKDADEYDIEYEEKPEDSETGRPQLILFGEIIEQETIEKLKVAGFNFLYAQSAFEFADGDEDEENETEEEEEEDNDAEIEAAADESQENEDEEDEFDADLEIVFEDTKIKSQRNDIR